MSKDGLSALQTALVGLKSVQTQLNAPALTLDPLTKSALKALVQTLIDMVQAFITDATALKVGHRVEQ